MALNQSEKVVYNTQSDKEHFVGVVEKKSLSSFGQSFEQLPEEKQLETIKKAVLEHKENASSLATGNYVQKQEDAEKIVLALEPEEDDDRMSELLGLVQEKGVLNTIGAIEKTESFHIIDDFHRVLVQYIKVGYEHNVKESSSIYPGLNMTLFEVLLPSESSKEDKEKNLETLLASMEQFYAGMFSVAETGRKNDNYFSIEIAYPQGRNEVVFFSAVPNDKVNIFKNQVLAIFPNASIKENTNDYNIFNKKEFVAYSEAYLSEALTLPIKTYKELNYDPLNILLQSFSNLEKEEGAAVQIMLSPDNENTNKKLIKALDKIAKGEDLDTAINLKKSFIAKFLETVEEAFENDEKKDDIKDSERRSIVSEEIKKKNISRFYKANIRLVTSGNDHSHARSILSELESSFHQFENSMGNKFSFRRFKEKQIRQKVHDYTFRVFDKKNFSYFNTQELTTIFHFPEVSLRAGDILSTSSFTSAGVSKKLSMESEALSTQFKKDKEFQIFSDNAKNNISDVSEYPIEDNNSEINNDVLNQKTDYKLEKPDDSWVIKGRNSFNNEELIDKLGDDKLNFNENNSDLVEKKEDFSKNKDFNFFDTNRIDSVSLKNKEIADRKNNFENKITEKKQVKKTIKENKKTNSTKKDFSSQDNLGDASFSNEKPVLLGYNLHQGVKTDIYMKPVDRMRHMYVIGKSGVGKTNILKNMIIQDIENGDGCCFIDPHGSDIEDIMEQIPPERYDDVIYFDPTDVSRPMAMNMLEYDPNYPEQKSFVVDELFGIFKKLYSSTPESMGPAFEQYFRNATLLVLEHPESGNTMVEISRVLSDESFRNLKLKHCKNMIVKQFWEKIATQAGGESQLENIVPYITNKFDVFLANDFIRPIIAQEKSAFNFRDVMDNKKILLVNLSKGKLGELNSNLIGLILVGKILMAALSRVDSLNQNLPPFYLYIDEFQNVTTDSISQILSEARKYKLSLNIAHQFIKQIDEGIRDAVFGNVGSMAIFRVGPEDAEFLEKQLSPIFNATDIMNLENYNAYLKILVDGQPQKPFNIMTYPPKPGRPENKEYLKKLASEKFGRPREEIEREVNKKFASLL